MNRKPLLAVLLTAALLIGLGTAAVYLLEGTGDEFETEIGDTP